MQVGMVEALMLEAVRASAAGLSVVARLTVHILRERTCHEHLACPGLSREKDGMGDASGVGHPPQCLDGVSVPRCFGKLHLSGCFNSQKYKKKTLRQSRGQERVRTFFILFLPQWTLGRIRMVSLSRAYPATLDPDMCEYAATPQCMHIEALMLMC